MKIDTSAVSEEVAELDLVEFFNKYSLDIKDPKEIVSEDLKRSKQAVMAGLLVFDDSKIPTFTFHEPIKNKDDEVSLDKVTFITRIYPKDQAKLSKGLNLSKDSIEYSYRMQAHLANLPSDAYLSKLSKFDLAVIQELALVFI